MNPDMRLIQSFMRLVVASDASWGNHSLCFVLASSNN